MFPHLMTIPLVRPSNNIMYARSKGGGKWRAGKEGRNVCTRKLLVRAVITYAKSEHNGGMESDRIRAAHIIPLASRLYPSKRGSVGRIMLVFCDS